MDYCGCGAQAEGRCVIDGAFFCARERRTYPGTIARILEQAGSPPPANWRNGLLCPSCYQDTIGAALPQVTAHLLAEERSVERLAVRLAERAGWWSDSVNGHHSVGVDIVTAAAGTRPDWLFANVTATMAALYATLARRRSLTPPTIEVLHEQTRPAPTLFNRKRTVRTTTKIGEVRAWPFTFRDTDRGSRNCSSWRRAGRWCGTGRAGRS
jgi:hypothetical protein